MPAVPRFWTRKSPTRIATVAGTTNGTDQAILEASTADSTEIAGVMIPSP